MTDRAALVNIIVAVVEAFRERDDAVAAAIEWFDSQPVTVGFPDHGRAEDAAKRDAWIDEADAALRRALRDLRRDGVTR